MKWIEVLLLLLRRLVHSFKVTFTYALCSSFQSSGFGFGSGIGSSLASSAATPSSAHGGGGMKVASISSHTQALRREWLSRVDASALSPSSMNRAPAGVGRNSSLFRSTCTLQLDPQSPEAQSGPGPILSPAALHAAADPNAPELQALPMSSNIRSIAQSSRHGPGAAPNSPTTTLNVSSPAPPQLNQSAARMSAPYGPLRGPMSSSPLPDVALVSPAPGHNSAKTAPSTPRGMSSQNSESQFAPELSAGGAQDVPQTPTSISANMSSVPGTPSRNAGNVTPTNKLGPRMTFGQPAASAAPTSSAIGTPTQSHTPSIPGHIPAQSTSAASVATPSRSVASHAAANGGATRFQSQILRGTLFSDVPQTAAANATLSRRGTIPTFAAAASNPKQAGENSAITNGSHFAEDKPHLRWNQPESTRSLTSVMGAVTNSIGAIAKAAAFGNHSAAGTAAAAAPVPGALRIGVSRPESVPASQSAVTSSSLFGNSAGGGGALSRGGGERRHTGLFSATTSGSGGASVGRAQEATSVPQSPAATSGGQSGASPTPFQQIIHTTPLHLQQQRPGNFKSPAFTPHTHSESSRTPGLEAHHSRAASSGSAGGGSGAGGSPVVDGGSLGSDYDQPDLVSAHS